jgi:TetR/AcrR family tetracycline transcriptional repressor
MVKKSAEAPAKERLSRERIVDCAIALADAEGLEAVTIRRLAQDQGVTPMALYWHFKDKDLLLDGIVERLMTEVKVPLSEPGAGRWDERFRELLVALLEVLRAHPAIVGLVQNRIMLSAAGLDLTEQALAQLREAGFTPERSAHIAIHAMDSIVLLVANGPGALAGEELAAREQRMRAKRARFQALPPERFPNILAATEAFVGGGSDAAYYSLGLDLLVAGIRGVQL